MPLRRGLWLAIAAQALACPAAAQQMGPEIAKAPAPVLTWHSVVDVPVPDETGAPAGRGPLDRLAALAARPGGGAAVVVRHGPGAELRLVLLDASGRQEGATELPTPVPESGATPILRSIAMTAEGGRRIWIFATWLKGGLEDEGPAESRLIAVDVGRGVVVDRRLPRHIAGGRDDIDMRQAAVLRLMRDGSLLAGGTGYFGPPYWWYARFSTTGNLLYEAKSRRFPDYIEDAREEETGGFSFLMVDAEGGIERPTVRRYGAGGRLASRRAYADIPQHVGCTAFAGATGQFRGRAEYERRGSSDEQSRTWLDVFDEAGVRRRSVDLGAHDCSALRREGGATAVLAARLSEDKPRTAFVAVLTGSGDVRWRLDLPSDIAKVAPAADGGAVVARIDVVEGRKVVRVSRHRAP